MIEGLKVWIHGDELKEIVAERAEYHRERAAFYQSKVDAMKGVDMESKMSGGNPVQQLETKRNEHAAQADEMDFTAKHIATNEVYSLARQDLQIIGIVHRGW